ncbi:MAG: SGNH/GDSL hydrolase family protein [Planctomycetota bacterium]
MSKTISLATALVLLAAALAAVSSSGQAADAPPAIFREGARVLFQGDSITDGGRDRRGAYQDHVLGHGYPYVIAANYGGHFPERKLAFFNRGVSGNKLSDLVKRWQGDTLALKPDVLSILIGVNDVWLNLAGNKEIKYAEIEATYDKLIADTQTALPSIKIVLCEPFLLPGSVTKARWKEWDAAVKKIQQIVANLGAKHKLPVVHFQKVFDDACQQAPAEYWLFDGVHPGWAGHQLMADEWSRAVKEAWPN